MREGEIAARTALGATRARIALQLVAETVVLVGVAVLLGLLLARFALGQISPIFFEIQQAPRPPFWWNDALSPVSFVFRRVALQLFAGIALGSLVAVPVLWNGLADGGPQSLVLVSIVLLGAGLAACVLPVRRALPIDPAAAVRME